MKVAKRFAAVFGHYTAKSIPMDGVVAIKARSRLHALALNRKVRVVEFPRAKDTRGGEQGLGFAVVATEVRSLAGRSAQAAKEIKTLIGDSVERVEHGTALVDKAGTTMAEVVNSIRSVTDIMGEISAASTEQSAGVAQIGEAISQMDQVTQQNAALVEEMAAAASSLRIQAGELVDAVAVFKLSDEPNPQPTSAAKSVQVSPSSTASLSHPARKAAPTTSAPPTQVRAGGKRACSDTQNWEAF